MTTPTTIRVSIWTGLLNMDDLAVAFFSVGAFDFAYCTDWFTFNTWEIRPRGQRLHGEPDMIAVRRCLVFCCSLSCCFRE